MARRRPSRSKLAIRWLGAAILVAIALSYIHPLTSYRHAQKEVAERLRARAGEEAYGPLTVMAQMLGRVEVLRTLPPQAFWPAPKIESSLVRVTREDKLGGADRVRPFGELVHKVFSFRRKTLRKALSQGGYDAKTVLTATGIDGQARPEVLTPEQFLQMFGAAT